MDDIASHKVRYKIENAFSLVKLHKKSDQSAIQSVYLKRLEDKGFTYEASETFLKWWIENQKEHRKRIDWWDRELLNEASYIMNGQSDIVLQF